MSCTRDMLSIVMDGIKDVDMMLWYSTNARENDCPEWESWFKQKAKQRMDMLTTDYDYVARTINLKDRVDEGDDIAIALHEHIESQLEKLRMQLK